MTTVWLGLDPSTTAFGVAALRGTPYGAAEIVELASMRPPHAASELKTEQLDERIDWIADELLGVIERVRPARIYIEGLALGMGQGALSVSASGQARGMVRGICRAHRIPIVSFRPADAKRWVTGRTPRRGDKSDKITKEEVARQLERLYPNLGSFFGGEISKQDLDATDALAIAHLGLIRGDARGRVVPNVSKARAVDVDELF